MRHRLLQKSLCHCPVVACCLAAARAEKARALFPRPSAGPLRPVVRGQTIKYNSKQKLGRGFTLEELKVRSTTSSSSDGEAAAAVERQQQQRGRQQQQGR